MGTGEKSPFSKEGEQKVSISHGKDIPKALIGKHQEHFVE